MSPGCRTSPTLYEYDMDNDKDTPRRMVGSPPRFPGGIVPAPGRSTPVASDLGESSEGLAVGLLTGPAAELATVRGSNEEVAHEGVIATTMERTEEPVVKTPKNKELRLRIERLETASTKAGSPTDKLTDETSAALFKRPVGGPRIVDIKKYPKEMRIRVVAGEIVHSPVVESVSASTTELRRLTRNRGIVDLTQHTSSNDELDMSVSRRGSNAAASTTIEESTDVGSSFEENPKKGKKRGRKPKGSNVPGSHALSKMSSKRMDFEDDELDREDFFKISRKGAHKLKKRRGLVECGLDDSLSCRQKDAVEDVVNMFPQMSPKSVMAETLRVLNIAADAEKRTQTMKGDLRRQIIIGVNVAKVAIQRLVSDISKCEGPVDEVKANNLALEREVLKLRKEMDVVRRERTALKDQVESLKRTVSILEDRGGRTDRKVLRDFSSDDTVPIHRSAHSSRQVVWKEQMQRRRFTEEEEEEEEEESLARVEEIPMAYRPALGGRRKRLDDWPPLAKRGNDTGRRVVNEMCAGIHEENEPRITRSKLGRANAITSAMDNASQLRPSSLAMDYPKDGEAWVAVKSRSARKRERKRIKKRVNDIVSEVEAGGGEVNAALDVPPQVTRRGTQDAEIIQGSMRKTKVRGKASTGVETASARRVDGGIRRAAGGERFRAPKTAAVMLKCEEFEDGPSYAKVLRLAREKISLDEMNIINTRIRRAQAGGLLIEIPGGDEAGSKADALVDRLRTVLAETDYGKAVSVIRPIRRAEVRLVDIDQSITAEEIIAAIANNGNVQATSIRLGPIRPGRRGLNAVWVQCPLTCANKLLGAGRLRLGWSSAGVVPLAKRRLQCFRCLAIGHTRENCNSQVDRTTCCFQCGGNDGHRAADCRMPPKCPVCAVRGMASDHRAGSEACTPFNGRGQSSTKKVIKNIAGSSTCVDRGAPVRSDGINMDVSNG